ncbi:homoserine O-acetyltransferase [Frankia sp. R82]|uniref:homoserine O-acetyltransferase MetX n=1 Tax=Frankia sp. R82 TaxID=2950553 RepID=UPI0020443792|nr:homoserine O-acetyltransferase [Frankia sp. R82]MCM3886716.1 homoserine O-acetyltransferase [Frankia sp. R82]
MPPSPDPPVSGAWRAGVDPVGDRRFARLPGPLHLERGGVVAQVGVAYETWGRLDAAAGNAVLVLHALTGDSHAAGPAGPGHPGPGWWDGLIGPGRALDTERLFVVAPNVLGGCQGTTGPASRAPDGRPFGSRWPEVTIGDQVDVEAALADALGIRRWSAVVGGSMGGMRALEWAVRHPGRVDRVVVLACGAVATAEQIGLYAVQLQAITDDPGWRGGDYHQLDGPPQLPGPQLGLGLARRMAQVSYRSEAELEARFAARVQPDGAFEVVSYLDHHADRLVRRFDAGSYVTLTRAMMTQDVGRGRGGYAAALRACPVPFTIAGVDSDRLYPIRLQQELADLTGVPLRRIHSHRGHDGFLLEVDQVAAILRDVLPSP